MRHTTTQGKAGIPSVRNRADGSDEIVERCFVVDVSAESYNVNFKKVATKSGKGVVYVGIREHAQEERSINTRYRYITVQLTASANVGELLLRIDTNTVNGRKIDAKGIL